MSTSLHHYTGERGFSAIAQSLRRAIVEGELPPGTQLPSIAELARRHGATAITVRRALRNLEEAGLIRVEHGVGTFVADWSRQFDRLHLPSFADEMAARALRSETEVRGRELAVHRPAAAAALGAGDRVHVLTRRRLVEGVPVVLQHSAVEGALASVVESYAPGDSLYERLREATGRVPLSAEETVRSVRLDTTVCRELEVEPGSIGWLSVRVTFDAQGQPLVYDEAFFPAERVAIHVARRAGFTQFDYRILTPPVRGADNGEEP